jgi:hypothetical protein
MDAAAFHWWIHWCWMASIHWMSQDEPLEKKEDQMWSIKAYLTLRRRPKPPSPGCCFSTPA